MLSASHYTLKNRPLYLSRGSGDEERRLGGFFSPLQRGLAEPLLPPCQGEIA